MSFAVLGFLLVFVFWLRRLLFDGTICVKDRVVVAGS